MKNLRTLGGSDLKNAIWLVWRELIDDEALAEGSWKGEFKTGSGKTKDGSPAFYSSNLASIVAGKYFYFSQQFIFVFLKL